MSVKISFQNRVLRSFFFSVKNPFGLLILFSIVPSLLLYASIASAGLSGSASLNYTAYGGTASAIVPCGEKVKSAATGLMVIPPDDAVCTRNEDGSTSIANGHERNKMSSNSLVQNYSLLYASSGPLYNNRVGFYDVSLGYNWTAIDTTFKTSTPNRTTVDESANYNETRGHLLYRGEITLDPKEVPIRLNAYSRDMSYNTVNRSSGRLTSHFDSIFGYRDEATGINDGMHIENGVTLIAGVKNGMTNGYNEILRHFPMILIDFKDVVNKDPLAANPIDDRFTRLAFVSLNKKDNWFHYRHTIYEDYRPKSYNPLTGALLYDPAINNYVINEVQLGTVDQTMVRRWIDFSNWIKVSTDIQFTKLEKNDQANPIEEVNLNLFVTGERQYWNARTFTTFNRLKDDKDLLSYQANLPLYVSGVVSRDTSWNARASFRNNHDINLNPNPPDSVGGVTSKFIDSVAGYRVDTFKNSLFTLSQNLDIESSQTKTSQTSSSDFLTLSGGLETTSTPLLARNLSLGASYNIKDSTTSSSSASSSDFLEQNITLHSLYSPTNTLRFNLGETSTFTKGTNIPFSGTTKDGQTQLSQYYNPRAQISNDIGNKTYHSVTTFAVSWTPKPRLSAYFTVTEDIFKTPIIGVSSVTDAFFTASFTNDKWSVSDTLKYTRGSRETLDDNASTITNGALIKYVHSRNLDASASASYSSSHYSHNPNITLDSSNANVSYNSKHFTLEQRANYNYFTKSGISRKLFEVNETLKYEDGTEVIGISYNKSLLLGVKYYPIRQLTLAAGAGYSYSDKFGVYTAVWNASAMANFRLLQVSLDYVHGKRVYDNAIEDKFSGNVRRSF
jgi:hypothetical protein